MGRRVIAWLTETAELPRWLVLVSGGLLGALSTFVPLLALELRGERRQREIERVRGWRWPV